MTDAVRIQRWNQKVSRVLSKGGTIDIHTHLYGSRFGSLVSWGIDDQLTYHYLVAEAFRVLKLPPADFYALPKSRQAELVWDALFVGQSPLSEATIGLVTTLNALGLDPRKEGLAGIRRWYASRDRSRFIDQCLDLSGVRSVYMTNSPVDPVEIACWEKGAGADDRFRTALRVDGLILNWADTVKIVKDQGFKVTQSRTAKTLGEMRRFLDVWTDRMKPAYAMISLPPDFRIDDGSERADLFCEVLLRHCADRGLPLALMIGVRRAVNPALGMAGDGLGLANLRTLEDLCRTYPAQRFLATVLARENQHELCVLARKFGNLHPFGCWWFTNVPSIISEITRMRLELLGPTFTAQHSDSRVTEHLIYKWSHTRAVLAEVLASHYARLEASGWVATAGEIERDVRTLTGGGFESFVGGGLSA